MRNKTTGLKLNRLNAALLAALFLPAAGGAFAQDTSGQEASGQPQAEPAEQAEATQLDKVTVTGSRIKRATIEGPAPVVVITSEDIEKEGFTTVYDALNTLTQFTGSVQNELVQNGFTPNASFVNLRGLGPGYQLILINGRRAADYPLPYNSESNAVNLANIPAAAIERIEILTGGASAIYGSDAVAGVVNIIFKTNFEGDQLTLRAGTSTRGGGDTGELQWVGGRTGDNWNLTYAFEALEREQIFASQRAFMDSYYDEPGVDDIDVNPVEGLLVFDGFTSNRIFPDGAEETCNRFPGFETFVFEQSSVYTGPRCGYPGFPATQAIRNGDSNQSAYLYGTWDFTSNLQGFVQFSHTRAEAKLTSGVQFWQSPGAFIFDPNLESAALGPGGGAFVQLQRIFTPEETGGSLVTTIAEKTYDFAAGLRGTVGRFDWDATLSRSWYELDSRQPRFLANPVTDYFLGAQQGFDPYFGAYPVYELDQDRYFNPIDPATFASLNTIVRDGAETSVTQGSFVFSGDLFELPAGYVGMAAVVEAAKQDYEINPDPRTNPNYTGPEPIYNLTSTGGRGDRNRYAAGLEFSVPILDSLKANLAGRYDKYEDDSQIDGASTWQAGLEWRPFDNLLLRASHGTSFRAPDMHYIYAEESGFFTSIFDEFKCRNDGLDPNPPDGSASPCTGAEYVYQVFGTRHGDKDLEAETGKSTTVGFVWDVIEGMSISLDYYKIELEDAVRDISGLLFRREADCLLGQERDGTPVDPNSATCQFYLDLVQREGTGPLADGNVTEYESFPINQSLNRTSGLDASWKYSLDTDRHGEFDFQLGWTHVLKQESKEFEGSEMIDERDHRQYFNFRSRMNGGVVWVKDDWTTAVYGTRWGSLPNWREDDRIGSHTLWNFNVSKKITDNATVGFYMNNVFDRIHPRDDTFDDYPFFWRAYSPVGREVFVQFDYTFN